MNSPFSRVLSEEDLERCKKDFQEDLQREANRAVRRHDSNTALAALEGIDYIDKFVQTLKLRMGSQIGLPARARPIRIFRKGGGR